MPESDPPKMRVPIVLTSLSLFPSVNIYLLGGLAGLSTTGLGGGGLLLGLLGAADGAHTGNGLLADISAVAVLGGLAGNTLEDPVQTLGSVRLPCLFAQALA